MRKLSEADRDLRWVQLPDRKRCYELRSGDDVIASLEWTRRFSFREAAATTAAGNWGFRHSGLVRQRVHISTGVPGTEVAIFYPGWAGKGTLRKTGGKTFSWRRENLWGGARSFASPAGDLVHLSYAGGNEGIRGINGIALVTPQGQHEPDTLLLLILGWFLMALAVYRAD
jgi:hypothetical protein